LKATASVDAPADLLYENLQVDMPLITLLLADEVYRADYLDELAKVGSGALELATFSDRAQELHDLVATYAVGADGETADYTTLSSEAAFEESVTGADGLMSHMEERLALVAETLKASP
jgi:hypothetical protein